MTEGSKFDPALVWAGRPNDQALPSTAVGTASPVLFSVSSKPSPADSPGEGYGLFVADLGRELPSGIDPAFFQQTEYTLPDPTTTSSGPSCVPVALVDTYFPSNYTFGRLQPRSASELMLMNALAKLVEEVRPDPIAQEASDGIIYFIREMLSRVSLQEDWVDTLFQTGLLIKNRRDTLIAHALSTLGRALPPLQLGGEENEPKPVKSSHESISWESMMTLSSNTGSSLDQTPPCDQPVLIENMAQTSPSNSVRHQRSHKRRRVGSSDSDVQEVETGPVCRRLFVNTPPAASPPAIHFPELMSGHSGPGLLSQNSNDPRNSQDDGISASKCWRRPPNPQAIIDSSVFAACGAVLV